MALFYTLVLACIILPAVTEANGAVIGRCLLVHNHYRARYTSPPLEWDATLAAGAQQYAEKLARLGKLRSSSGNYGENLFMSWGGRPNCVTAANSWYSEVEKYDFNHPGYSYDTGDFTQLVWKSSRKLGVGIATVGRRTAVVARYSPPGNYPGKFRENVVPV